MRTSVIFCLLLVSGGSCSRVIQSIISFPALNSVPESTNNKEYGANTVEKHFPQGTEAVQSIANLVLKMLDHEAVRTSPKNWVVSPLSLAAVLAQLLLGSRGNLQKTLVDSLSLENSVKPTSRLEVHRQLGSLMKYLERSGNASYLLELNAAIFIQPEILLKTTYKHALFDFYDAEIHPVDFWGKSAESTKKINDWVNASTHGKLPRLYPEPLPAATISLMANVVYFIGRWQIPFDPEFTKTGKFFINENQQVDVEYMFGERELLYKNTSEMQLIGIPYKDWQVVLYILLPHERLASGLSVSHLDQIISEAMRENITLVMPKLKLLSTISVRQSVLKYLMNSVKLATRTVIVSGQQNYLHKGQARSEYDDDSVFENAEKFDVGGASQDSRFKFDDVIHQVSLEVDEKGSEIAAVTATLIDYSGVNFLLKIDRPFWFFIRHEYSRTPLFWGRIVDPSIHTN